MRKFVIVQIALLCLMVSGAAAEWVKVYEVGDSETYMDPTTILKQEGSIRGAMRGTVAVEAWTLENYKNKKSGIKSSKKQILIYCESKEIKYLNMFENEGNMGKGHEHSDSYGDTRISPVSPDSKGERLWQIACGKVDIKTLTATPPAQTQYWSFCEPAAAYYPYVQSCDKPWKSVPATPAPINKKALPADDAYRREHGIASGRGQPGMPAEKPKPTVPPRATSLGTGILFNQAGQVFTAYHVVLGAKHIKVKFVNGETILAGVFYADIPNDIAVLTLASQPKLQLKRISLADSSKIRAGEKVFTIGYPVSHILGKEPKYSEGVINSLTGIGDDPRMFQISVPIQGGNSGGPLFNEKGEVVGLVTSTFSTSEGAMLSGALPQNVNFAVKSRLFAENVLAESKGVATSGIVPVLVPFSIPVFVDSVKNNVVLIEAGE